MWYTTGKISVTNKSANVTATGTQWSVSRHGVLPGMIFIGPDGKLYEIQRVNSDTSLTLSAPYSGPTAKDQSYAIITTYEGDLTQFSAKFSNLLSALAANKGDLLNWMTAKGSINIAKEDGSTLTVPTLDRISEGANRASNAGFGSGPIHRADVYAQENTSFINRFNASSANAPIKDFGAVLALPISGGPSCVYFAISASRGAWVGSSSGADKNVIWHHLWGDRNTSVDANGFIKKASPIARLSGDPDAMDSDYLDGFTPAGLAAVNDEASGVKAERQGVGVYTVTGSLGLAKEGWTIEVPQDINGNRLCFVEAETAEDGTITVRVCKRRFDIDTAAIVAGEPMDIPAGRWIDLRLEMPVSEIDEAPEAVEETAALENVNVAP